MMFKKAIKDTVYKLLGITAYKWSQLPPGLYCFNYHRIGDRHKTQFDPNVFSCTAESFHNQLRFLKQHFKLIDLSELQQLVNNPAAQPKKYALITFDDGYMDNHDVALPILKAEGVSAVFFISVNFVGNNIVPWWDQIAWWLRHSKCLKVVIDNKTIPVDLTTTLATEKTIRKVLNALKADSRELNIKLLELYQQLQPSEDVPNDCKLFMGLPELKKLILNGMSVGSHTCDHHILSHLTAEEQLAELTRSKQQLEHNLGCEVNSLAYPVGDSQSYTAETQRLAEIAGYKVAFNFTNSFNLLPITNPLSISRIGIDSDISVYQLKKKVAFSKGKVTDN
ncbi:MAG: polysaccharide deacetylase family protein [Paraglaciecola sp.]|nr:polysaccharide deacetylase family protein [Paraglaciecola sp.]